MLKFSYEIIEALNILLTSNITDGVFQAQLAYGKRNKTLGRARDPRANGAWLSKLTEWNMKCLS